MGCSLFVSKDVWSQCANNNAFYTALNPTGPGNTQTNNCIWGGEYVTVNVCEGASYTFATCGSFWDTQITVYSSTGGAALAYNDDGCGLQSTVTWTATFTGTVRVLVDQYFCQSNFSCGTISVTQNTACAAPPPPPEGCDYEIIVGGGFFDEEISWTITNQNGVQVASGFANDPAGAILCLDDGCYTLNMFDSWGDGWNGAVAYIYDANGNLLLSATLASGSFGTAAFCTEPADPPCFFDEPSGCPDIDAGVDIVLPSCFTPCSPLQVEATVFETGLTTSYEVCAIDYAPPFPFNAGTPFSVGVDDVWTGIINLPFNFCFYGNVYSQAVVGSNGLISFNTAYANGFCPWAFTATVPNAILPLNSIFGPYHDIDPSVCGDAKYAILGTAPCRAFVVSFDNICQFDCTYLISSHQIVLYETTNVIEVYIDDKPTCNGWNSGNAVIGIQDASGVNGAVAPGRQTGPWTANTEAWRFTPNGAPNFEVQWFEGQTYIGTGLSVEVCPDEPSHTYIAIATYTNCDGSEVEVFDDVNVVCSQIMLPVELTDFSAEPAGSQVLCEWRTETEWNSDYFTVERSADLQQWKAIGRSPAAGFAQEPRNYNFVDAEPLPGLSYYRLRTTDLDATFSLSQIEAVEFSGIALNELIIVPNPNSGTFGLRVNTNDVALRIFDPTGREVPWEWIEPRRISLRNPVSGTYILELTEISRGAKYRERFVIGN